MVGRNKTKIGHNFSEDEVIKRVKKMWNLEKFPTPKFKVVCPICGSSDVIIKEYRFSKREFARSKYRCVVGYKCTNCSLCFEFGLVIPKEIWEMHCNENSPSRFYYWREIKNLT